MPNSVMFNLPKTFVDMLKNKNVVITEVYGEIIIKEAIIDDVKIFKLSKCNQVTYTTLNGKETIIGDYEYEIENGCLILYRED